MFASTVSPCGRDLIGEVKIKYGTSAQNYFGGKSGRADIVDKNTGEFWEIKSDYTGTGLAQALFDVKGYSMSGNIYINTALSKNGITTPIIGGELPGGAFIYKAALFEYYDITYYNPKPGVILYNYTKYTNYADALETLLVLLLAGLGVPLVYEPAIAMSSITPVTNADMKAAEASRAATLPKNEWTSWGWIIK